MYMQSSILSAAATAGPHIDGPRIDPTQRSGELQAVLDIANASRAKLRTIGPFSVAPARADDDRSYFAQIRAQPKRATEGLEFRYDMPAARMDRQDVATTARTLTDAARTFDGLEDRRRLFKGIKQMAGGVLAPASSGLSPMRFLAGGITLLDGDGFTNTVDVEMLGPDLTIGIERVTHFDMATVEERLEELVDKHLIRSKLRAQAIASRALGSIDDAALRILEIAGISLAEAVGHLRQRQELSFSFGGNEGYDFYAAVTWCDGVIRGQVQPLGKADWAFEGDLLMIHELKLPETVIHALAGRRIGEVITHAFIPADALIASVRTSGQWTHLTLVIANRFLDEAAGMSLLDSNRG